MLGHHRFVLKAYGGTDHDSDLITLCRACYDRLAAVACVEADRDRPVTYSYPRPPVAVLAYLCKAAAIAGIRCQPLLEKREPVEKPFEFS